MEPLNLNFCWRTDSYKLGHWSQIPPDTQYVYSYLESRTGGFWNHTLFTGLQGILKANFTGVCFTKEDVEEARMLSNMHFGNDNVFNYKGWMRLLEKHGGRLPLRIRAPKEGTLIQTGNALVTIVNTDPEFPWLTNWAETILLHVWYPITVGTLSFEIRQEIGKDLVRTGRSESGGLQAARFRLSRRFVRGVGSNRRRGSPVQLPRHRHSGGCAVHPAVLRWQECWRSDAGLQYSSDGTQHRDVVG
jgi:nicotinamide phosphoribosyltransferase